VFWVRVCGAQTRCASSPARLKRELRCPKSTIRLTANRWEERRHHAINAINGFLPSREQIRIATASHRHSSLTLAFRFPKESRGEPCESGAFPRKDSSTRERAVTEERRWKTKNRGCVTAPREQRNCHFSRRGNWRGLTRSHLRRTRLANDRREGVRRAYPAGAQLREAD